MKKTLLALPLVVALLAGSEPLARACYLCSNSIEGCVLSTRGSTHCSSWYNPSTGSWTCNLFGSCI